MGCSSDWALHLQPTFPCSQRGGLRRTVVKWLAAKLVSDLLWHMCFQKRTNICESPSTHAIGRKLRRLCSRHSSVASTMTSPPHRHDASQNVASFGCICEFACFVLLWIITCPPCSVPRPGQFFLQHLWFSLFFGGHRWAEKVAFCSSQILHCCSNRTDAWETWSAFKLRLVPKSVSS